MSNTIATVSTALEGGTVTITYGADYTESDGLTQDELVTAVVGLIPGLVYAATYGKFEDAASAETLREFARLWEGK